MPEYIVKQPIGYGGIRREKGETVILSEESAKAIGEDYLELVESSLESASVTTEAKAEDKAAVKPQKRGRRKTK